MAVKPGARLLEKAAPGSAVVGRRVLRARAQQVFLAYGMLWALVILVIAARIVYPGFFEVDNIRNMLSQSAPVGIVAVGMTFVMIGGGFDLSVGSIFALGAVIYAERADHFGLWGAAFAVIAVTFACGLVNGLIVTKLKVNPFVATLGTGSAFGGIAYIYSHSAPETPNDFNFGNLGTNSWVGVPISIWLMLIVFLVGGVILARSVYGRSIYAIGGNNEAARLSGVRVDLLRASTYVLTAVCAGIGGMILASRLGVGQADMGGSIALDSIAIVVIGGTSLLGGEGAMWRTAVGLLTLATLTNVFDSLAVSTNYQLVVKGCIVVGAVALDVLARSRSS
jgi:ribose transport system permease protein